MATSLSATDTTASIELPSSAVNWATDRCRRVRCINPHAHSDASGLWLGLTMVSPWSNEGASVTTFAVSTAIWLIVVQWLSSAAGGYLTGRLRTKWVGIQHRRDLLS